MKKINQKELDWVFRYFEEICAIPRGSGNMEAVSDYCVAFAKDHGLQAVRDGANNVVIYKPGARGYENARPVILQGHLDMVCQKTEASAFDFATDGIEAYTDGDFIRARGTTLGADNGIAVAMILAVLASRDLPHPPLEAVFTTDEEIGMLGAQALDASLLKGRKMINLDAEEAGVLTVSCAGGSDFQLSLPVERTVQQGTKISLEIQGLKGGHSGVDIDKGRVNASLLTARILYAIRKNAPFTILSINGGTKTNAIPFCCRAELVTGDAKQFMSAVWDSFSVVKREIEDREESCTLRLTEEGTGDFEVLSPALGDKLLNLLLTTPNGVVDMSAQIEGLVETSLNLGILMTEADGVTLRYALRSNQESALAFLEDRLTALASQYHCRFRISGRYAPWEFRKDSPLQALYIDVFDERLGYKPKIAAIHAGLECAVFARKLADLDCIAIGPDLFDVHTVHEKLSVSSTRDIFDVLCGVLERSR